MQDTITEVREIHNGVRITVNDQHTLCLTKKNMRMLSPRVGDPVNWDQFKQDVLLEQYPDALNRAVRLLAVRARSSSEIAKRLSAACFMAETVEMVLTKLEKENLLDDRAFARQWARDRVSRQMGSVRIRYELRQKGVAEEIIQLVMEEVDPEQHNDSAAKLAAKLMKRYQNIPRKDAQHKTIMAMQRRGYSYSEIQAVLTDEIED